MQNCIRREAKNDDKCQKKKLTNVNGMQKEEVKKETISSLPGGGYG